MPSIYNGNRKKSYNYIYFLTSFILVFAGVIFISREYATGIKIIYCQVMVLAKLTAVEHGCPEVTYSLLI